jgi:Signal peptide peptidase
VKPKDTTTTMVTTRASAAAVAAASTSTTKTTTTTTNGNATEKMRGPHATFVVRATNPYLMLSYATIVLTWAASQIILIPYVLHLLVLVTAILYAACHGSLVLLDHSGDGEDEIMQDGSTHSSTSNASSNRETLRREDALQFPIIGSISLFSLYLCFKFLDKDLVNLIIGGYFGLVGCVAMTMTFAPAVASIFLSNKNGSNKQYSWQYKINHKLPEWICGPSPLDLSQEFNMSEILALIISAVVCGFYVYYKPWYLNNVIGICFCLQGIERFSLGTYKIGAILLIGLFFYDIFWVREIVFWLRSCSLGSATTATILCLAHTYIHTYIHLFSISLSLFHLLFKYTYRYLAPKSWSRWQKISTAPLRFSFHAIA